VSIDKKTLECLIQVRGSHEPVFSGRKPRDRRKPPECLIQVRGSNEPVFSGRKPRDRRTPPECLIHPSPRIPRAGFLRQEAPRPQKTARVPDPSPRIPRAGFLRQEAPRPQKIARVPDPSAWFNLDHTTSTAHAMRCLICLQLILRWSRPLRNDCKFLDHFKDNFTAGAMPDVTHSITDQWHWPWSETVYSHFAPLSLTLYTLQG
jgi:hypothetical protein